MRKNQKNRQGFASPDGVSKEQHMKGSTMTATLRQFFETVYRPLRLRGGSFRTDHLYNQCFARFGEYLGHEPTIDDLDDLAVAGFLEARRRAGRSPYTVERERSILNALWNLAARRGVKATWPDVPPGKLPRKSPEAWSLEEMQRLFKAARETRGWVNGVPANVFWPALLAVLWETGERISGVLSAQKADYRRPHLLIRAAGRKGGTTDKMFVLTPATCHRLELAADHSEPMIFYWPGCHSSLWGAWKRLVQRAGLTIGRGTGFHKIRRTAASFLAQRQGAAAASEFLGHASPDMARRWYLDPLVTEAGKPAPCDVLPRIDLSATG